MKSRAFLKTIFLVLPFLIPACASNINEIMDSWLGHHQSELIASWGPPQRTSFDGKGGTILIYEQYVDLGQEPGKIVYQPGPLGRNTILGDTGTYKYTAPKQRGFTNIRMFYVNPEGYIYFWRRRKGF